MKPIEGPLKPSPVNALFLSSCLQNPHFRKTNTGYSAGPGLESYLKGFNFTGEPPWALYSWGTRLYHILFLFWYGHLFFLSLFHIYSQLNWIEFNSFQQSICALLPLISNQSKGPCVKMNTELDFSFLEEGFSAKDIVEQKIKESSMTVNALCSQ